MVNANVFTELPDNDKTKIFHLLENYRRTIDVSAISHGLHQESAESAWVTLGTSRNSRSQVCDSTNRSPPFLLREGPSTLSQTASLMPRLNQFSSFSRTLTSLRSNECPELRKWLQMAEFCASMVLGLLCCPFLEPSACLVSPT